MSKTKSVALTKTEAKEWVAEAAHKLCTAIDDCEGEYVKLPFTIDGGLRLGIKVAPATKKTYEDDHRVNPAFHKLFNDTLK